MPVFAAGELEYETELILREKLCYVGTSVSLYKGNVRDVPVCHVGALVDKLWKSTLLRNYIRISVLFTHIILRKSLVRVARM